MKWRDGPDRLSWTEQETATLIERWSHDSVAELRTLLPGRGSKSICNKARKLHLQPKPNPATRREAKA